MTTAAVIAATAAAVAASKRMSLAGVLKGKIGGPKRVIVYGLDGVGKTTFAAAAPSPIFLSVGVDKHGTDEIDTNRWPQPEGGMKWPDILAAVYVLTNDPHEYQSMAMDTVDAITDLLIAWVCERAGEDNIDKVDGGFGRGMTQAVDQMRILISALEQLQAKRGLNVILLAHSQVKPFNNPLGDDFDRYSIKMHDKLASLLREWVKGVYFAAYKDFTIRTNDKDAGSAKGVAGEQHVLYTQRRAAYDAKDRYGLPKELALNWEEFDRLSTHGSNPDVLKAKIESLIAAMSDGDTKSTADEYLKKSGKDAGKLAATLDWLNGLINAQTDAADSAKRKEAA